MGDQTGPQKLDLAQRILKALTCTEEPQVLNSEEDDLVGATKICEMPFHLRHLSVLHSDLNIEMDAAQARLDEAENQYEMSMDAADSPEKVQALINESGKAEFELNLATEARDIVYNLIFASLENYIPIDKNFDTISLTTDWSVFGGVLEN